MAPHDTINGAMRKIIYTVAAGVVLQILAASGAIWISVAKLETRVTAVEKQIAQETNERHLADERLDKDIRENRSRLP